VLLLAGVAGCESPAAVEIGPPTVRRIVLETVATGLASPVLLTSPPADPRLFVVEQPGRIRIIDENGARAQPFLDITDRVGSGAERGLLGLAFPPDHAATGEFIVDYTDRSGDTRIERYHVTDDPDIADPSSGRLILAVEQPFANHNGGMITFGPDGMLYIGLGDGGSGGDPRGNGQNRSTLLGSILRIDTRVEPYAVPPDNPFAGMAGARPEIWAWGLRNPWRFSFDRAAGLLFIADVGQDAYEEINVARADAAGLNYGWNVMEAGHCFSSQSCSIHGLTLPVLEYEHADGCSVTGGFVYRGSAVPTAAGLYFYADYCVGWIRSFRYVDGQAVERMDWGFEAGNVLSFGEDANGEVYVLSADGVVRRLAPATLETTTGVRSRPSSGITTAATATGIRARRAR